MSFVVLTSFKLIPQIQGKYSNNIHGVYHIVMLKKFFYYRHICMSSKNIPRLFINKELKAKIKIKLNSNNKHYLKNVLRLSEGKVVNIFNGIDGEWETEIDFNIDHLTCKKQIRKQTKEYGPKLYFSLIKNHNIRWMIEKVTELGVEQITPIVTDRTNNKNFNEKKFYLTL